MSTTEARARHSRPAEARSRIRLMYVTQDLGMGGLEQVIVTLCRTIDRDRFSPSVLCLRETGPLAAEVEKLGIPVLSIDCDPRRADYGAFLKVARVLRDWKPDVLHTHNTSALLDGWAGSVLAGVRTVVHTDHARDFPDRLRYMVAEHVISHFLHGVVAVSEHTARNLVRYERISAKKIHTIPNGIDGSRYEIGIDRARKRRELGIEGAGPILGVGARLTAQKGIAYLLEAFAMSRPRFPGATLLIAGEGDLEQELKARAASLGLRDDVRFLGLRLDMPELLQLFDVYVLPSLWEGLPMGILEAMAAGCPIVATRVGGVPDAITDGVDGALVDPRDPRMLAERLETLLASPETRARYAGAAKATFRGRFSAEAMTREYEALYLAARR